MNKLPAGWKLSRLEELATVERGKFSARPRNDPKFFGGDIPFVQTGEVSAAGTYLINHKQTLNELGKTVSKVFPKDSILITIAANIGETAITTYEVACPDSVVAIIPKPAKAHVFWLKKVLETLKDDLDSKATQNAQKNINLEVLRPLEIATPPIEEQTKIAQILSAWDKAITTTERLLANSQQQKDMLTNQLLTGQQRFSEFVTSKGYQRTFHGPIPSDWNYVPIADIANQQSKANSTQADLPVLSCSKYDGLVDSLKYFKKKVYSDDTSKYRVVEFGDFAYPSNHIEEGSIGYQDVYPAGIVSPIYTVFRTTDAVDDYFLYRTLKTDKYRQIFSAATSASVDRRGSLRWKEFSKIQVPLPSLAEQQKIAQVLSTADAEITNLQAQLAKLKLEKKALMQQLLTGQRRVKLDADAAA